MADPHFVARGVFEERIVNENGEEISALPTPIVGRAGMSSAGSGAGRAPALGEHTRELLGEEPA